MPPHKLGQMERTSLHRVLGALYDQAIAKYGRRCLWNAAPSRSISGIAVVAERLQQYGNMDAWRLAAQIHRELNRLSMEGPNDHVRDRGLPLEELSLLWRATNT